MEIAHRAAHAIAERIRRTDSIQALGLELGHIVPMVIGGRHVTPEQGEAIAQRLATGAVALLMGEQPASPAAIRAGALALTQSAVVEVLDVG